MSKDRTQKTALEMTFNEFHSWSVSHVLFEIGEGRTLRDTLQFILDHAARSRQFGNNKQVKHNKPRDAKCCFEMNFNEFHSWAVAHTLFELGAGQTLRSIMGSILQQLAQNEVFGVGPNDNANASSL